MQEDVSHKKNSTRKNARLSQRTTEGSLMHYGHVLNLLTVLRKQVMANSSQHLSEHQALLVTISSQQLVHSHTNMARTHLLFLE